MHRAGVTLVELLVVIAILSLIFGVSGLAFASLRVPRESEWIRALRRARAEAIQSGLPTRTAIPPDSAMNRVLLRAPLFLPDGRAVGSGADPLTGAPFDAAK
jgi:prepilin-type N-terminal cleavage/methylation domain-containing protein